MRRIYRVAVCLLIAAPLAARAELETDFLVATNAAATNVFQGAVGIGTSAPAAKLHVAGDLKVEGAMIVPRQGDVSMGSYTNGLSEEGTEGDGGYVSDSVSFLVSKGTNQTFSASTWTKVTWDEKESDIGEGFDLGSNEFGPPSNGEYIFSAATRMVAAAGSFVRIAIYTNSTAWRRVMYTNPGAGTAHIPQTIAAGPVYLTTNDTVSVYIHYDGGAGTLSATSARPYFWFAGHHIPSRVLSGEE